MVETKITIKIISEHKPSVQEVYDAMQDMKNRMAGYNTVPPEILKHNNMEFDRKYHIDGVEYDLYDEVKKVEDERDISRKN